MKALVAALKNNRAETEIIVRSAPAWNIAARTFDAFFKKMADPKDKLWSEGFVHTLHQTYLRGRDEDKSCANITIRTVNAMPKNKAEDTKKIMLQIAHACRIFNASHKVNFDRDELPKDSDDVPLKPSSKKDFFTYRDEVPSLYPKTSLTFDYWVPKIFDWTQELRERKIKTWTGESLMNQDASTDFMRICLLFIADPKNNPPIAKAEDREAFLKLSGGTFAWIKKSAKREDILLNSAVLTESLNKAAKDAGIPVPVEAWSRLAQAPFIKPLIKGS